jgi:hypothetical protein
MDRTALLDLLKAHFNDSELRDLCFDLHIIYEDLGGDGKAAVKRQVFLPPTIIKLAG